VDSGTAWLRQKAADLSEDSFVRWVSAPALLVPRLISESELDLDPPVDDASPDEAPALDYGEGVTVHLIRSFDERAPFSIGRARERDVILRHPRVSRLHARLVPSDGGRWAICDEGSRNGTFVNGWPIGRRTHVLHSGDRILFGRVGALFLDGVKLYRRLKARQN
jgi:hypothetical protein